MARVLILALGLLSTPLWAVNDLQPADTNLFQPSRMEKTSETVGCNTIVANVKSINEVYSSAIKQCSEGSSDQRIQCYQNATNCVTTTPKLGLLVDAKSKQDLLTRTKTCDEQAGQDKVNCLANVYGNLQRNHEGDAGSSAPDTTPPGH
jgi:hypothetical protein